MNIKILVTVFAALVLLGGTVNAQLSCSVTDAGCGGGTGVFSMWSNSNSHAELPSQTFYTWDVCCSVTGDTLNTDCATGVGVISLYQATNSHVMEAPGNTYYDDHVCLGATSGDIECGYVDGDKPCTDLGTDYTCLATMSSAGNAHVGNCGAYTGTNNRKVCCQHVVTDTDGDGVADDVDLICPNTPAGEVVIIDSASAWYGCGPTERDLDFDGLNDSVETDGWDIPNWVCSATDCFDQTNPKGKVIKTRCNPELQGVIHVTSNPTNPDSDNDGFLEDFNESIGWDVRYKHQTGPAPNDFIWNTVPVWSDPSALDTDGLVDDSNEFLGGDGIPPGQVGDLLDATFPTNSDSDCDRAWATLDGFEIDYGLNPVDYDTDGDGISDGFEIDLWLEAMGYDLTNPDLIPEAALLEAVANAKDPNTPAELDITPDTLNLKSRGKWITAFIEPFVGSAEDVEIDTVFLEGTVPAVSNSKYDFVTNESEYLVDHDSDGILERKVKFDRASVQALLTPSTAELTVSGSLSDGTAFSGTDTIRAIKEGREATGARIGEIAAGLQNAAPGTKPGYIRSIADTLLWWYYTVVPADLTVGESDIVVSDPIVGQEVTIDVTVKNSGETDAGAFSVDFSVDGTHKVTTDIPPLDAGSSAVTQFIWIAENGAHDIEIDVDTADSVKELSEENNAASVKVVGKKK